MIHRIKSVIKWTGGTVSLLVLAGFICGFLTYLLLLLPPVQKKVLSRCQEYLNSSFDGTITIGTISTNLMTYITIGDISVRNCTSGADSLHIGYLHATYTLPFLLVKRLVINEIRVKDVALSLSINETGTVELKNCLFPPRQRGNYNPSVNTFKESNWEISANKLKINGLSGTFHDKKNLQSARVRNGTIAASFHSNKGIEVELRIKGAQYRSRWWNGDISMLDAACALSLDQIAVSRVMVQAERSVLRGNGVIPLKNNGLWDLSFSTRSEISAVPVLLNALKELDHHGSVTINGSWTGSIRKPNLHAQIQGNSIGYNNKVIDSFTVGADYTEDDSLDLHFTVASAGATVEGNGGIIIRNLMSSAIAVGNYSTTFTVNEFDPTVYSSNLDSFHNSLSGLKLSSVFTVENDQITGYPQLGSLFCSAYGCALLEDTLTLSAVLSNHFWNIHARLQENTLSAQGQLFDYLQITGSCAVLVPMPYLLTRHFVPGIIQGDIRFFADLEGTILAPEFSGVVKCVNGLWKGICIDSATARLTIAGDTQVLDTLSAVVHASGDALTRLTGKPFSGSCTAAVSAQGGLRSPDVNVVVSSSSFGYGGNAMDSIRLVLQSTSLDSVTLKQGAFFALHDAADVLFTGSGSIKKRTGTLQAALFSAGEADTGRCIGRINCSAGFSDDSLMIDGSIQALLLDGLTGLTHTDSLQGVINATVAARGMSANPMVHASVEARDIVVGMFKADSLRATALLKDSSLHIASHLIVAHGLPGLSAEAQIPLVPSDHWNPELSGTRNLTMQVNAKKMPLAKLLVTADTTFTLDGLVTLSLNARNSGGEVVMEGLVDMKAGSVYVPALKVNAAGVAMHMLIGGTLGRPTATFRGETGKVGLRGGTIHRITALGSVDGRIIDLYSVKVALPDSGLVLLKGKLPLGKPDTSDSFEEYAVDFSILYFPLSILASFLSDHYFDDGVVQGGGKVTFQEGKPVVHGAVTLENGLLVSENINPSIGPISAMVRMAGDSLVVERVHAAWGGKGSIDAEGCIAVGNDGQPVVAFELNAENCTWTTPDVLYGAVDRAALVCSTSNGRCEVSGTVEMGPTRYIQDLQITDIIGQLQSGSVTKEQPKKSRSFLNTIQLNVGVDLQENAMIDINLGSIKLDGDCRVTGTAQTPSFIGDIEITEGYILYLDRQFEINRATFSNYNSRELHPVINLEATADILSMSGDRNENYTILLSLKGDMKNPVFTLQDETGTLNELEIISILTLGQPLGGISGAIQERLTAIVSQGLAGFGSRKLEQFLSLEKIDLSGDIFDGKQVAENTRLTIAKRVTPRLMVLYESDIGKRNKPKISALYRIASNIFLSGETDSEGEAGLDIIFKYSR